MLLKSGELARGTRENDLDKDEKLGKAEKLANEAITIVGTAEAQCALTDTQWNEIKKEYVGDAHRDLGMIAMRVAD